VRVFAQDAAHDWQKTYPVGGSASLSVEGRQWTGDPVVRGLQGDSRNSAHGTKTE
jgi:hypothetical protein